MLRLSLFYLFLFVNLQQFGLHSYRKDNNCLHNNNKNATEFAAKKRF